MFEFKIKSPVGEISKKFLHRYQAGEAVGQIIECMDGSFEIDESCLIHSDILYDFFEGTYSDKH